MGNLYGGLSTARNWCAFGICLAALMIVPHSLGQGMAALSGKVADTQGLSSRQPSLLRPKAPPAQKPL